MYDGATSTPLVADGEGNYAATVTITDAVFVNLDPDVGYIVNGTTVASTAGTVGDPSDLGEGIFEVGVSAISDDATVTITFAEDL